MQALTYLSPTGWKKVKMVVIVGHETHPQRSITPKKDYNNGKSQDGYGKWDPQGSPH